MTDIANEQQAAAPAQQMAAAGSKRQLPRFNHRIMVNYEDRQVENIRTLKQKTGGTENSVLRAAIDVFAYLNGLPVETDPTIYLNNYFVIHQAGPQNGR
jgi:hypothetical protein